MNLTQDDLNAWESRASRVNACLMKALRALDRGDIGIAQAQLTTAQELNWQGRKDMLAAGAVDSATARLEALEAERQAREYDLAALQVQADVASNSETPFEDE